MAENKEVTKAGLIESAAVILLREEEGGLHTFWLRRAKALRMAGGFYAFPGGKVDAADETTPAEGSAAGLHRFCVAAVRELFEETGVLLAKNVSDFSPRVLEEFREALMERKADFAQEAKRLGLRLDTSSLVPAGLWITPPFFPVRFYTRFFLLHCPQGAVPQVRAEEAEEGRWVLPGEALRLWEEGEALLHPPNLHIMRCLAGFRSPKQLRYELENPPFCTGHIAQHPEYQRGVLVLPLKSNTLPPAKHTNTYVLGTGELWVVDPGFCDEAGRAQCLRTLSELKAMGKTPKGIFLTHQHVDHVEGAHWLKQQTGLPVACHALTARHLGFAAERLLEDGETLVLEGPMPMHWEVLHTPGHAAGHLCLWERRRGILIAGDMVAGQGTISIVPPEGDMAEYVSQLERLLRLGPRVLHPAHGLCIVDAKAKLESYLRHRAARQRQLLALLRQGVQEEEALCEGIYGALDQETQTLARGSVQALLCKLQKEGQVACGGGRWFLC